MLRGCKKLGNRFGARSELVWQVSPVPVLEWGQRPFICFSSKRHGEFIDRKWMARKGISANISNRMCSKKNMSKIILGAWKVTCLCAVDCRIVTKTAERNALSFELCCRTAVPKPYFDRSWSSVRIYILVVRCFSWKRWSELGPFCWDAQLCSTHAKALHSKHHHRQPRQLHCGLQWHAV